MIKKSMEEAVNRQINAEFYSAYLYLSMAAYFEDRNLGGFANWMIVQAKEEKFHAMKLYRYLNERGGRVKLMTIEDPEFEWDSVLKVFEEAYAHEQKVTGMINDLVDLAISEKDHATRSMLQWYVDEQVEEEATAENIVERLKMIKDHSPSILMMDREMGSRSFNEPEE
jgi:ferritin